MSISVACSRCGSKLKAPESAAGRKTKCPKCGTALVVPGPAVEPPGPRHPQPLPQAINGAEPPDVRSTSVRAPAFAPAEEDFDFEPRVLGSNINSPGTSPSHRESAANTDINTDKKSDEVSSPSIQQSDIHVKIAAWVAGVGLLLLCLSPFFKWINFASGGVTGLSGDGMTVLGMTVVAIGAYITTLIKKKWITPVILGVQMWGTLAVFWMGKLIWKVGSIRDSSEIKDNPFASLVATQISPGAGLYLGLIGGIAVAGSLGFIAVRRLLTSRSLNLYYTTQGLSIVLGILLVFVVGPDRRSQPPIEKPVLNAGSLFRDAQEQAGMAVALTAWKKAHNVSSKQLDELIDNFEARKRPESVGMTEWWEEAKNKTPAKLNKLYPPLKPREWYRAEWVGDYLKSRELDPEDGTFGNKPATHKLRLKVIVRTERDLPIKELHGVLAFVKDGNIIYETQLAEKPDVSFTNKRLVWFEIDPYDDSNQAHRTLRFAKDNELTPVFTVSKVILADGREKTFD